LGEDLSCLKDYKFPIVFLRVCCMLLEKKETKKQKKMSAVQHSKIATHHRHNPIIITDLHGNAPALPPSILTPPPTIPPLSLAQIYHIRKIIMKWNKIKVKREPAEIEGGNEKKFFGHTHARTHTHTITDTHTHRHTHTTKR
jgi:hypothetical protein